MKFIFMNYTKWNLTYKRNYWLQRIVSIAATIEKLPNIFSITSVCVSLPYACGPFPCSDVGLASLYADSCPYTSSPCPWACRRSFAFRNSYPFPCPYAAAAAFRVPYPFPSGHGQRGLPPCPYHPSENRRVYRRDHPILVSLRSCYHPANPYLRCCLSCSSCRVRARSLWVRLRVEGTFPGINFV